MPLGIAEGREGGVDAVEAHLAGDERPRIDLPAASIRSVSRNSSGV